MALHVHTDSMVEIPWLIAHTTYDPNLYVCGELTGDHQVVFRVAATNPAEMPNPPACPKGSSVWRNVVDMRAAAGSAAAFDALLADELMIIRQVAGCVGVPGVPGPLFGGGSVCGC
jgi:hypothetical protein